ncbi:hypothetical protein ACJD0Z_09360 [Flavobacteriaceae bacterium M23B6Z8]
MEKKTPYLELLYQYKLKRMEAEVYIENLTANMKNLEENEHAISDYTLEMSIRNSHSLLVFYLKRKSIIDLNIKNITHELEKI